MAKLIFKNYKIKLYGKDYSILVPDVDSEKFYICTYLKFFKHGENFIETDMQGLKVLRDSFAALALEPWQMIYLPLKRRKPEKYSGLWEYQSDIVIYNHQIQLKRKLWKKLKQCMRYRKGEPYVMHVDYRELEAMRKREWKAWAKNDSFYKMKNKIVEAYYFGDTWFLECNRKLAMDVSMEFYNTSRRNHITISYDGTYEVESFVAYTDYEFCVYVVKKKTLWESISEEDL